MKKNIDIEKIILQTNGSMTIEDMPLTKSDIDRINDCIGNDIKVEETIKQLIKKHTKFKEYQYEQ